MSSPEEDENISNDGSPYCLDTQEIITKEEWMAKLNLQHVDKFAINKLIMNYLVTEGFEEAANNFQQESGTSPGPAFRTIGERIKIRDAIQNGHIQKATAMVNELHPELLDNESNLNFYLQQLYLIELIKENKVEEALNFAQERLSETGASNPSVLPEIERTLALLAFEDPSTSPFSDLLQPAHREKIANEFNAAILKMENQYTKNQTLSNLFKLILWAERELVNNSQKEKITFPNLDELWQH